LSLTNSIVTDTPRGLV